MANEKILQVVDLCKSFHKLDVLKHISVDFEKNEVVSIIGPSGGGKSTCASLIPRFWDVSSGRVLVGGVDVRDMDPHELMDQVAFVFQTNQLFRQTLADNVRASKPGATDDEVRAALSAAQCDDIVAKLPQGIDTMLGAGGAYLSGGEVQRVALARALIVEPKLCLLDEPLSNLDAALRVRMRGELKRLQRELGTTMVFVTHDQEEALTLSDRIAVFNKGIIEQIGTPNEVYNHSQTEFVCNFIGDINRLNDDTVSALRAAGAEVDASKHNYIRLERLHVNVAPRGGEIALDGTVESCEYYGLYIKYYIHVGTQSLKVIEKNDGVNIYDPGQRVKVILNPNDIMAYAPSAEEVE